ncbi:MULTISPECIES: hypothetical protein [Vibrio]|uniref:hypothetical protein n=1 Tax=Vibrio TaxID=662 RepID=UPI000C16753E|nr:hypothetical protein [Vibrio coralliilyticus]NRF65346.1 hypothetical protein [Vibrio coralliilyticus]
MKVIDRIKRNPVRFAKWLGLKFIKLNKTTKPLILYPSYFTAFLILGFLYLASSKGLLSKDINEIGDSVAGLSGVLAFLWLIVTVLLQNRDLNLQYNEIKDMRAASESQAQSLESSQIFQTLEYLEVKLESISDYVCQRRGFIIEELESFSKENGTLNNGNTRLDLADAMDYFVIDSRRKNVLDFELSNIRDDFTYQSYLRVQAINLNIEEVVIAYNSLMLNVPENIKPQVTKYINAHKKYLMVDWYDKMFPYTDRLYQSLMRAAVEHGIGTEANRVLLKIFSEQDS